MAIISFKPGPRRGSPGIRSFRLRRVSFRPACCGGTHVGGVLTVDNGLVRREMRVAMTWDVLDRLRSELARQGSEPGDATTLQRVLTAWGIEEYERRLAHGDPLPAEDLLLTLSGGPGSDGPRRLLTGAGLLPVTAG